jgi:hypothetical protein
MTEPAARARPAESMNRAMGEGCAGKRADIMLRPAENRDALLGQLVITQTDPSDRAARSRWA